MRSWPIYESVLQYPLPPGVAYFQDGGCIPWFYYPPGVVYPPGISEKEPATPGIDEGAATPGISEQTPSTPGISQQGPSLGTAPGPSSAPPKSNPSHNKGKRFVGGPSRTSPSPSRVAQNQKSAWAVKTPNDAGYPWPGLVLNAQNYPTPGMFFDANNPQGAFSFRGMNSFVKAALGTALSMAGLDPNIALANTATARSMRKEMLDLIQCSKFNDGLYGSSSSSMPGPMGRGITWEAKHADVFGLLQNGKMPFRTIDAQGRRLPKYVEQNQLPLVWVPAVCLDALHDGEVVAIQPEPTGVKLSLSGVRLPGGVGCAPAIQNPRRQRGDARAYWQSRSRPGGMILTRPTK